ncbi:MAG: carboxymuconolactone decarboxylase family protein, partial [Comamonas sp.]
MPRISLPAPEAMSPAQRQVYDKVVSGPRGKIEGPLRAALHNAELADCWQALGALLRYRTGLTPRQSEIAILVTGRACQSP